MTNVVDTAVTDAPLTDAPLTDATVTEPTLTDTNTHGDKTDMTASVPQYTKAAAGDHGDGDGDGGAGAVLNSRNGKDNKDATAAAAVVAEPITKADKADTTDAAAPMSTAAVAADDGTTKIDTPLPAPTVPTSLTSPSSPAPAAVTEKSVHDSVVAVGRGTGLDQDSWVDVQQKTFIRWANYYLAKRGLKIKSVTVDLTDGIMLNNLLELLSHKTLRKWKVPAKSQIARLDNLSIAFEFMQSEGMKLINVRSQDVETGNVKITLGLLWSLIQHYQIMKFAQPKLDRRPTIEAKKIEAATPTDSASASTSATAATTTAATAATTDASKKTETPAAPATAPVLVHAASSSTTNAKTELLAWVNGKVSKYDVLPAKDFTHSFVSGHMLTALTQSLLDEDKNGGAKADGTEKSTLDVSTDPLTANTTAIAIAESALHIPPLVDADDVVHRPNEQSMMTYIACFRDRGHISAAPAAAAVGAPVIAAETTKVAEPTPTPMPTPLVIDTDKTKSAERVDDVRSETVLPPATEQSGHAPITPRPSDNDDEKVVAPSNLKVITPTDDQPKSTAADVSPRAVAVAVNAPDQSMTNEKSNVEQISIPSFTTTTAAAPMSPGSPKEVEVCMTNVDMKYVHAVKDGSCKTGELNSQWSTWTVIDSPTSDIVYFRDPYERFLNCDDVGRVYMADQSDTAKWKVIRGQQQHFISHNGLYLTAQTDGRVTAEKTATKYSALTLCFPVVEGLLKKKGRSGFKSWQERYFAFNGAVMSYWKNKAAVAHNGQPKGVYMPNKITSVIANKHDKNRFNIVIDGETIEFEAKSEFEAARWVKALNTTGIRSVDDSSRRWSVLKIDQNQNIKH